MKDGICFGKVCFGVGALWVLYLIARDQGYF